MPVISENRHCPHGCGHVVSLEGQEEGRALGCTPVPGPHLCPPKLPEPNGKGFLERMGYRLPCVRRRQPKADPG